LQSYSVAHQGQGWNHPVKTYADLDTVWAMKREFLGRERTEVAQVVEVRRTSFKIRFRSDVDTSMRVKDGNEIYNIVGIRELGRQHMMELITELRT